MQKQKHGNMTAGGGGMGSRKWNLLNSIPRYKLLRNKNSKNRAQTNTHKHTHTLA